MSFTEMGKRRSRFVEVREAEAPLEHRKVDVPSRCTKGVARDESGVKEEVRARNRT